MLGTNAANVGVLSVCALLVASGESVGIAQSCGEAGLALAGGLIQAGVLVAFWPIERPDSVRKALSVALPILGLRIRAAVAGFSFACRHTP